MTVQTDRAPTVGDLLRTWRQRRRLTQLELANSSEVSARHLSFVETGRARPTREMILHLSEHLEVPLRQRNEVLLAGGFAPVYPEHELSEAPMSVVSAAVNQLLDAHPYPAVVVDRHWELVASNEPTALLLAGAASWLVEPPINVLRLSLHPEGMAPRIVNLAQWKAHLLGRLARQADVTGDPVLFALLDELRSLPGGSPDEPLPRDSLVVPLRYRLASGLELSMFSMTTVFGTPLDVTVSELAIETFYPASAETAAALVGS
ncbi:helix-turn-helix domain-containing protein [Tenggerimyces flavus]|uniref:Helix-turn-helix domain-containing protein n=1 Tax=Tenggerimyces flavus TaxID=1708749 RepID=A0ABV7YNW4_9ACTN|nr:helix-turn-helix transcriptional regulator [Tenggerimyces flavus]MBM7784960.1 transcriptional regulator with XRE-family HTH domain [Tenggerimyces flavus]